VGWYFDSNGNIHGFLLSRGQYTTLDDPSAVNGTVPQGINDRGQIVGWHHDTSEAPHGFNLSGGQYTTLDEPNATRGTLPSGINNRGAIVGEYVVANSNPNPQGFLATPVNCDLALPFNSDLPGSSVSAAPYEPLPPGNLTSRLVTQQGLGGTAADIISSTSGGGLATGANGLADTADGNATAGPWTSFFVWRPFETKSV
jgi:probable HAF family extracellular repeat protein